MSLTGGSAHNPDDNTSGPKEFKIQILPAGSAPAASTHEPNVGGDLAPGQPNNSADTTYDDNTVGSKTDVQKGLGDDGKTKEEKDEEQHVPEIKSATERMPETADSL